MHSSNHICLFKKTVSGMVLRGHQTKLGETPDPMLPRKLAVYTAQRPSVKPNQPRSKEEDNRSRALFSPWHVSPKACELQWNEPSRPSRFDCGKDPRQISRCVSIPAHSSWRMCLGVCFYASRYTIRPSQEATRKIARLLLCSSQLRPLYTL